MATAACDGKSHSGAMYTEVGEDDEWGIQMSDERQIGGGVILGAWRCQVVGVYTPVA